MQSPTPSQPTSPSNSASRLPRATTFRQSRPASTGPTGLRRGATFANRPQSHNASLNKSHTPPQVPRLRRGTSFRGTPPNKAPPEDGKPQLRRASQRFASAVNPAQPVRTTVINSPPPRLPRAGTFSYSSAQEKNAHAVVTNDESRIRRMSSSEKALLEKRCCGMCSSCSTGLKAMPPWAPERLKLLSEEERETVLRELHHKEEMGRLEAELRRKRLADRNAVSERIQNRLAKRVSASEQASLSSDSSTDVAKRISIEEQELESVDLCADEMYTQSTTTVSMSESEDSDDTLTLGVSMKRERSALEEECQECDDVQHRVKDLEEQLDVLREVVNMCSENEQASCRRDSHSEKKGKSWMGKIASAYYGSSAAAAERNRLKTEVDALRKATDFLFQKLQVNGS